MRQSRVAFDHDADSPARDGRTSDDSTSDDSTSDGRTSDGRTSDDGTSDGRTSADSASGTGSSDGTAGTTDASDTLAPLDPVQAGDAYDDPIALGDISTLGHDYGGGDGALGGRVGGVISSDRAAGPAPTLAACDRTLVHRVVRAHLNEIRFCYERALVRDPSLTGRVLTRFTISPDGHVRAAEVARSTLAAPAVHACVTAAVQRWRFAACPEPVDVTYPFVFVPAE